jgi:hypothetical protein
MRRALPDREELEDARCAEGGALDLELATGGAVEDIFYVVWCPLPSAWVSSSNMTI